MTTLITILNKNSIDDLKVTVQKSKLFAQEQFEECFNEIIEERCKSLFYILLQNTSICIGLPVVSASAVVDLVMMAGLKNNKYTLFIIK